MPAAHGRAVDLRRDARPRRRPLQRLPAGPARARRPALPPGDEHPRDDLGDAHRLGHRRRPAADRPVAPRQGPLDLAPPLADRHGRRPRAAADDPLHQRARRDARRVRAAAGLRPARRDLGLRRRGLRDRHRARRGPGHRAAADDRPAPGLRARARPRALDAARGRPRVRRAQLDRARARPPTTTRRTAG